MQKNFTLFLFFILLLPLKLSAQLSFDFTPATEVTVTAEVRGKKLHLNVKIPPESHIYPLHPQKEGPGPSRIFLSGFEVPAKMIAESPPHSLHDPVHETELSAHKDFASFIISLKDLNPKSGARGYLLYQICDNFTCSLPLKAHFHLP